MDHEGCAPTSWYPQLVGDQGSTSPVVPAASVPPQRPPLAPGPALVPQDHPASVPGCQMRHCTDFWGACQPRGFPTTCPLLLAVPLVFGLSVRILRITTTAQPFSALCNGNAHGGARHDHPKVYFQARFLYNHPSHLQKNYSGQVFPKHQGPCSPHNQFLWSVGCAIGAGGPCPRGRPVSPVAAEQGPPARGRLRGGARRLAGREPAGERRAPGAPSRRTASRARQGAPPSRSRPAPPRPLGSVAATAAALPPGGPGPVRAAPRCG